MSGHTPGPWRVSGASGTEIEADNSTFWVWVSMDTPEEEIQPNARLIASAPCLLRALEEIECTIIDYDNGAGAYMIEVARKAIARAKGEK